MIYDSQLVKVWTEEDGNSTVSPPINRALYCCHSIQYISDGEETLKVETSLDGENWVVLDGSIAPNSIVTYERHIQWLRFTKGSTDTVSVLVAGVSAYGT